MSRGEQDTIAGLPQENTEWMIWPDGTMGTIEEIWAGEYDHMSDEYRLATDAEVIAYMGELDDEIDRSMEALGLEVAPRVPFNAPMPKRFN